MIPTGFPWTRSAADCRVIVTSLAPLRTEGRMIATFHGARDPVVFPSFAEAAANAALTIRACNALGPHLALLSVLSQSTGQSDKDIVGRLLKNEFQQMRMSA
jgi:hypothetical protein